MTEKYIDLAGTIIEDLHLTESEASGADAAMRWLQMHPGQVPGRTITEQQLIQLWQVTVEGRNIDDFAQELKDNGITVVPDPEPEPTNAELLVEDLAGIYGANLNWTAKIAISEALAERGWVKAPGGDDEH